MVRDDGARKEPGHPGRRRSLSNTTSLSSAALSSLSSNHEGTAKGENPFDKYEKVRPLGLHPVTRMDVVRAKNGTSKCFTLKRIALGKNAHLLRPIRQEVNLLRTIDHPNIASILEVYEYSQNVMIVMEHCDNLGAGPIWWKNAAKKRYDEEQAAKIIQKILTMIRYLHEHNIASGDLRPEVLVFEHPESDNIKLIDYGSLDRFQDNGHQSSSDSFQECRYCCAPETLMGEKPSLASDMWSLGVIAYILLSGRLPFDDEDALTSLWGELKLEWKPSRAFWKDSVSADAMDFCLQLLRPDEEDRMSAVEATQHAWMRRHATDFEIQDDLLRGVAHHLRAYIQEPKLKKAALTIVAQRANSAEVHQLRNVFEYFDADKNGSITKGELHAALRKLHLTNEQIMDVYDALDTDGNATIEYTEFLGALLELLHEVKKDDLQVAFRRIAGENNENITIRGLIKFFDVSFPTATKMLEEVDADSNGRISFEEFYHVFRAGSKTREVREKRLKEKRIRELEEAAKKRKNALLEQDIGSPSDASNQQQRRWKLFQQGGGDDHQVVSKEEVKQFLKQLGSGDNFASSSSMGLSTSIGDLRKDWMKKHQKKVVVESGEIPTEIETDTSKFKKRKSSLVKHNSDHQPRRRGSTGKATQQDEEPKRVGRGGKTSRGLKTRSRSESHLGKKKSSSSAAASHMDQFRNKPRSRSVVETQTSPVVELGAIEERKKKKKKSSKKSKSKKEDDEPLKKSKSRRQVADSSSVSENEKTPPKSSKKKNDLKKSRSKHQVVDSSSNSENEKQKSSKKKSGRKKDRSASVVMVRSESVPKQPRRTMSESRSVPKERKPTESILERFQKRASAHAPQLLPRQTSEAPIHDNAKVVMIKTKKSVSGRSKSPMRMLPTTPTTSKFSPEAQRRLAGRSGSVRDVFQF